MNTPVIITLIIVGGLVTICAIDAIKNIIFKSIESKKIDRIFKGGKK